MHTILGAGGVIGTLLLPELAAQGTPVRLVSRRATMTGGAKEVVQADLSNRQSVIDAVAGSDVVYLLAGLKYELRAWQELWPRIMANAIEACQRANARLVFFDNVYMYGRVDGPMTEETPFNPCSRKGEVRAKIAQKLLGEVKAGGITAMIARAADFYGPNARTGVANILVFDKFAKGGKASVMVTAALPHSYTYTPDAAKALVTLTRAKDPWNTTWHLPTAPDPPTGKQFVEMAARTFGVPPKYSILQPWMLRMVGLFDATVREIPEMLYQNAYPYHFDSSKFRKAFGVDATPYARGVEQTAASYR
jgi:nucleoside-diphosphate-sugar epimerase